MILSRLWSMPNKWTFKMPCLQPLFAKYHVGADWADPFSGLYSPAFLTNDIEPSRGATTCLDGLAFLKKQSDQSLKGVLFDPPYSTEQCLRKYTPKHGGTAGKAEYWAKCKDEIARIVVDGGHVISFGWDSCGVGHKRGFTGVEYWLICHGACHNDTIVSVERKNA